MHAHTTRVLPGFSRVLPPLGWSSPLWWSVIYRTFKALKAFKTLSCRAVAWKSLRQPCDVICVQLNIALNIWNQQCHRSFALIDSFTYTQIPGKLLSFQELPQGLLLKEEALPNVIPANTNNHVFSLPGHKKTPDCQRNYNARLFSSLHKEEGQRESSGNSG